MAQRAEFAVWDLAATQSGIVTRRQALAAGMTTAEVRRRVRSGVWRRLKPGVYVLPGHGTSDLGLLAAACAALGASVSHASAANIHGFRGIRNGQPTVTVRVRSTNRFPGVRVHQLTDLTAGHVTTVDGLAVTTPSRTLFDLAATMPEDRYRTVADKAFASRRVTVEGLAHMLSELGRRGKPGSALVREILEERTVSFTTTESVLEEMVLTLIRRWGMPDPVLQHPLPWRHSRAGRVDFAYPQCRLIIEADGRAWHALADAFDTDRMRDNHAQIAGWRVIRVTYRMLVEHPERVRSLIQRALATSLAV